MNTTEILNAIKEQLSTLEVEHSKTSKAARGRARSAANNIKKLAAEFKKTSSAEDKAA
jgi:hypothetical protein